MSIPIEQNGLGHDAVPGADAPTVPDREELDALTVVGLGASAGGIQALREFFENVPANSDMAFVVILHLSPEHESHLAQVISQITPMPVQQVMESVKVEPDHVYVIPPAKNLTMRDGRLHLSEPPPLQTTGRRVAVDLFFRSLASAHGPEAVAVILSGTGNDGSLGLKQVKEAGGLVVAQEPDEAEHGGMPRSAISTGMVDYVLPVRDIAAQIMAYRDTSRQMHVPQEAAPSPEQSEEGPAAQTALLEIISHVRGQTGHDFAHYKRATVLRRIGRRLQVNGLLDLPSYVEFLRRHPTEVVGLVRDLLISVTQFFRDPDAWEVLEQEVIPRLFENKGPNDSVRAWVCGCATGEEAYSLAFLLAEHAERVDNAPKVQVFATDMDDDAIGYAREGSYLDTIVADVTPERLRRWFIEDSGRYRVKKEARDLVLFASHDILRDTPFSRQDLVTCRNLLIYLTREAQQQVLTTFHFALRPEGHLFLGQSESVDEGTGSLFSRSDKPHRLFVRRSFARPIPLPLATVSATGIPYHSAFSLEGNAISLSSGAESSRAAQPGSDGTGGGPRGLPASVGALHQSLLELYAPPSVLVNDQHEIVHLSDSAGRFLRVAGGEPTTNLLRLVHPDLRLELRAALIAAEQEGRDQTRQMPRVALDENHFAPVRLTVRPVRSPDDIRGFLLVLFEEGTASAGTASAGTASAGTASAGTASAGDVVARQMEAEVTRLQGLLLATVKQHETSIEDLKASNEELQAINEELRSATEELQTSREELQSVNEELSTTNVELKSRMEEASQVNADLQNLLAATDIGTVFLDREQRIQRYTPAAAEVFNVIPSDVGRPLAHVTHRLEYPELSQDADRVLQRLAVVEREVRSTDGLRWFLVRLRPYRTLEDRISGVVATFIDVTRRKEDEEEILASVEALRQSEERFRLLVEGARDYAMFLLDAEAKITFWSSGAERVFGWSEAEMIGRNCAVLFTPEDLANGALDHETETALSEGRAIDRRWHLRKDGSVFWADGLLMRLDDGTGRMHGFAKVARDATAQKQAEEAQQASEDALKQANEVLEDRVHERTAELAGTSETRRNLLRQIVAAQEEERRRISREMHDEMGQHLTGFLLRLKSLQDTYPPTSGALAFLEEMRRTADEMGREVHRIAVELRPTALDDLGLAPALQAYVESWSERIGIPARCQNINLDDLRLPPEIETTAYRVAQEALTNVARHARNTATSVSVMLQRYDGSLSVVIEDDGPGFDPEAAMQSGRLGVIGMRERAELLDGTLEIESTPGSGTAVYLRLPLPETTSTESPSPAPN